MPLFVFLIAILTLSTSFAQAGEEPLYKMDFEDTEVGEVPDDFLVLEGEFAVEEEEDGNKVLVLPGQPVSTFTTLLGPAEIEGYALSARVKAEAQKRRFSSFAIGMNGVSGYRLQLTPVQKRLELYKEDNLEASSEYRWKSGEWTHLKMQVRKREEGKWLIEGKAWKGGEEEPSEWSIAYEDSEEPHTGRPSIWGIPFAERPIWYDDITITPAEK